MLSALALWVVLMIMDLLMPLQPAQGLSDPGRRPKSLDHQRVACGPHCPSRPVVGGGERENPDALLMMYHEREPRPGRRGRGCWQRQGLRGEGGRFVRQGQARANLQPQKTGASTLGKPLPAHPLLLKGSHTPCAFTAFHGPHPHAPSTSLGLSSERTNRTQALWPRARMAPGTGVAPGPSHGHRSSKRADFVYSLLFTVVPTRNQNRAWHIVGA